ncbi:c-Myc-binding protein-like [Arctopsyche grandis]|uniref:c-Myc-binding protein-like n=1 Tax=Arctopsyche grandis TaxID=121162 RepID=UPI00406D67A5
MSAPTKATESKREKFRKFVERCGIMEIVTRALTDLYEEQLQEPEEALDFFRKKISVSSDEELAAANARIQELEAKIANLPETEPST